VECFSPIYFSQMDRRRKNRLTELETVHLGALSVPLKKKQVDTTNCLRVLPLFLLKTPGKAHLSFNCLFTNLWMKTPGLQPKEGFCMANPPQKIYRLPERKSVLLISGIELFGASVSSRAVSSLYQKEGRKAGYLDELYRVGVGFIAYPLKARSRDFLGFSDWYFC